MKREARRHGMVRTYPVQPSPWNLKPKTRQIRRLDPVPVSGSFSNVKANAVSHSKFTGKCGKSKDKTKGAQKFRTSNIAGFKFSGFSATGVLEYLESFNEDEIDDHDDVNDNGGKHVLVEDDDFMAKFWSLHDKPNDNDNNEDEDDHTSFCDSGFTLDIEEDEGRCLLGEL